MPKKFYSVKEASKILGVSTNTVYKYLDEGSLKGKRHSNRGRFKIPFSEIEPYLAGEESPGTGREIPNIGKESTSTINTIDKVQVDKRGGAKLTFFELWFGASLVGLVFIYFLWNFGQGAAGSQIRESEAKNKSSLLTDIGNATLGYSARTFSQFGSLISHVLPAQEPKNEAQRSNEIVNPLTEIVSEGDTPDLSYKTEDTERRTYELYVNAQVLSSSTQRLLGKSRILTSTELNDAINEMSQLLGSLSDSSDKKTIYAEINWLDETWDFSTIEAIRRAASQVSYILDSLQKQSLGAFTKPELSDLNNLVSETDLLQRLVGSTSDTSTQKTLYGNIKEVEILAQALDAKTQEIDKVLGSWDSYNISEKENTIKSILSESLSLNILPKVDEVILSGLLNQGSDIELKNSLLSVKGVLAANKTYLAQKAGKPVVATWLESGGNVFKILVVNPSASASQEVTIKYYLPAEIGKEPVGQIDEGLKLSFDSQRNQYYVEGSLLLGAGEIKTIGLKVNDTQQVAQKNVAVEKSLEEEPPEVLETASSVDKPSDKVVAPVAQNEKTAEPSNPPANAGQVAGVNTVNYPAQGIVVWGSIIAVLILGLVLLVIYLKSRLGRGDKKPEQAGSDDVAVTAIKETSILLPEVKLNPENIVVAASPSRASFTFPRIEFTAIRKDLGSIKTGILTILTSITAFFSKILTSIKKFFISLTTGLARFIAAIVHGVKKFFVDAVSAVRRIPVAIKTGLTAILVSIAAFFSKLLTSIKKFFILLITGLARFVASIRASFRRAFRAVVSAVRIGLVSIKTGTLTVRASITAFFSKSLSLTVKLAVSIKTAFVNFIHAIITSLQKGLRDIAGAITKFFVSIKTGLITIGVSIATFFSKLLASTIKLVVSVKTGLGNLMVFTTFSLKRGFRAVVFATKKGLVATLVSIKNLVVAIVASFKRGFLAVVFAFKTFFVNVASAIRNALISIKTGLVTVLVSIKNLVVAMAASLKRSFLAVIHAIVAFIVKITSSVKTFLANVIIAIRRVLVAIVTSLQKILVSIAAFFIRVLFTTANLITAIVTSLKKVVSTIVNAAITLLANILSAVTKIVTSLMAGTLKAMLAMVKGLLNILNFIAKLADSALAQLDFQNPTIHRSPPNFPKIATFLLVGLTSATVLAVLAFKFISVIKADSLVVLDKEAVDQTEEIKIGSSRNEDMVLIKVSDGSNVNVRQEATTSSKIIAKIKYTKMVSKVGEEGDWTEIATGPDQLSGIEESLTGWVSSKLIETSGEELSQVLESQKH
ncbi:hypothetical protein A3E15_02665 [Candidatus Woesebacteria bacterium RIFCSPHIGHO2_12_FULL_42_9]|uniref:SH3b domain-containing protein n=1 Tax=Candidatus Woesebacteria bacterium RIFCSPHIGHO2_12_FULL_42_9 TaxID=1802511 RepID=A0A1F8AWC3_9BACT|nr:MAG: hypothetical protein A3E15_02665 [Candidatus Woesebacteria bacterium RIFCSPHIGHO2_12_FULL_42_9]